jgi:methyl-accepting chemotaxis protein
MSESQRVQSGRQQRSMKNLLLDRKFQLKYTGYLVGIAFVLSASLGCILFGTSAQVIEESHRGASQGQQIVDLGADVVSESRKVSEVVKMSIDRDPVYKENPELLESFNSDAAKQDAKLDEQIAQLKAQRSSLVGQAARLRQFHRTLLLSVGGILTLLVLGIGAAGIFVTHKVAGPIFKMKRHLREVSQGKLDVPWGLRKGDELVDFFEAFREMVVSLRNRRDADIEHLDKALTLLEEGDPSKAKDELSALKSELQKSLN